MNTEPTANDARVKLRILLTMSLVSSLIVLDTNIVAVSLPAIGQSLGASFRDIEWVVSAYLLSYASLLMGAGAYADLQGRKKVMAIGLALFAIASGLCGTATSSLMLNIARSLQGCGGALLLTDALAIISNTFTGDERTKAFAIWGACLGIALTTGPIIGGYRPAYNGDRQRSFLGDCSCKPRLPFLCDWDAGGGIRCRHPKWRNSQSFERVGSSGTFRHGFGASEHNALHRYSHGRCNLGCNPV